MRAGDLNQRVTIETRAVSQDSFGGQSTTWSPYLTVYAGIRALSGRELEAAQAVRVGVTHEMALRYQPDITAAMRARVASRIFDIRAAYDPDGRRRETILQVSEGLTEG